jgi:MFS transporter, DHA2 family, multidrug resistance protein
MGNPGISMTQGPTGLPQPLRWQAMLAVALSVLLSVLDYAVANVALPTIARDMQATSSQSIWVINAYQLASLAALLPLASIGARIGFARMCRIGIMLFMVASALCALSHTLLELTLARALQGFGGACIMSVNIALIRFIYPHEQIGRGIALNGLVIGSGVALGPTIGSIVLSVATWPWIFWINIPLALAALGLAWSALPQTPRSTVAVDVAGIVATLAAFVFTVLGLDDIVHGHADSGGVMFVVGIIAWALLLRRQRGRANPIVPVDLLRDPEFAVAFFVGMVAFIASNFFIISMPFTLETLMHRSPSVTGFLIAPWAVGVAVMSYTIGKVADRLPAGVLSTVGIGVTALGFLLLRLLPSDASNVDIVWRTALAGCGFGAFQPPNNRMMMILAPRGREGGASGLLSVARLGGQTLGALLVAGVFAIHADLAPERCLALATLSGLVACLLSGSRLVVGRRRQAGVTR